MKLSFPGGMIKKSLMGDAPYVMRIAIYDIRYRPYKNSDEKKLF